MVTLEDIAAEAPDVERQGSICVLRWHRYQFGMTVLNDGTIGQFTSGFARADVEQRLSGTVKRLFEKPTANDVAGAH